MARSVRSETDIAKHSLALFGIIGSLRRIANGLDSSYRVKTAGDRVFALRVSSGIPIRRVSRSVSRPIGSMRSPAIDGFPFLGYSERKEGRAWGKSGMRAA